MQTPSGLLADLTKLLPDPLGFLDDHEDEVESITEIDGLTLGVEYESGARFLVSIEAA